MFTSSMGALHLILCGSHLISVIENICATIIHAAARSGAWQRKPSLSQRGRKREERKEGGERGWRRGRQGWKPRLCGRQGIVVICCVVNSRELKHPSWQEERSSCNLSGFGSPGSCQIYPAYISSTSCCGKVLLPPSELPAGCAGREPQGCGFVSCHLCWSGRLSDLASSESPML